MSTPQVLVLGGGIAGLATAWELHQQKVPFLLLEAGDRVGGVTGIGPRHVLGEAADLVFGDAEDLGAELDVAVAEFERLRDAGAAVAELQ